MLSLIISAHRDDAERAQPASQGDACSYCGLPAGIHNEGDCCAACRLVRHLDRPCIDEEVCLIWLPEMSQAALICLVREMHSRLRAGGEGFDGEPGPVAVSADRSALHYARLALSGRAAVASELVGTTRASELAQVLARMSRPFYERRHKLLGGLRVLPNGRFFVGGDDVYPEIVDSWRHIPTPAAMPNTMGSTA